MSQPDNKSKRAVIVFNKKGEYVAVIASITQAALIQGVNKKLIYYNCIGKSMVIIYHFTPPHPHSSQFT